MSTTTTTTTTTTAKSMQLNGQHQQQKQWKVHASEAALNTSNPIREIIETMNIAENPNKKVIPLSIGDPTIFGNLKPCKEIPEALQRANAAGKFFGYQTAAGMESAREAVAEYHLKCTGNRIKPQDVILASGCSHAIDMCICVLANQGQNILIPRPGFPLYKTLTSVYGVQYKQYNLLADQNWSIDLQHLESLIDENTAAIVVNNPSNPCGSVFSKRHLMQILELAHKHRLPIIADEIYDKFVFPPELYQRQNRSTGSESSRQPQRPPYESLSREDNTENRSMSSDEDQDQKDEQHNGCPQDDLSQQLCENDNGNGNSNGNGIGCDNGSELDTEAEHEKETGALGYVPFISLSSLSKTVPILTCGGISKTCLIPGLRLGWVIINDKHNIFDGSIRNGLSRLTQRLMGPNSLVQGALGDILRDVPESFYKQTMDFIFRNAKMCYDKMKLIRGLHPFMPQGSMYLMARFDAKSFPDFEDDLDFTSKLMNEESVLVLPGKCFDFPQYFRICLTVPTNVMEEALNRIKQFCERHHIDSDGGVQCNGTSSIKIDIAAGLPPAVGLAPNATIKPNADSHRSSSTTPLEKVNYVNHRHQQQPSEQPPLMKLNLGQANNINNSQQKTATSFK